MMFAHGNSFQTKAVRLSLLLSILSIRLYAFAGGTGELRDPYQIATAEQLVSIGSDPNLLDKHFVLINDIDLDPNLPGGRVFTQAVIAPNTNAAASLFQGAPFNGDFDGNGHTISNLTIRSTSSHHLGLFGRLALGATVRNLKLVNAEITGDESREVAGALAGSNYGSLTDCVASAAVSANEYVGGLVGYNAGIITDCHVAADIWGSDRWFSGAGGFVGSNAGILANSSAHGKVAGGSGLGGLAGSNRGVIWRCFASGEVTGDDFIGGLVGSAPMGRIQDCYATTTVSSRTLSLHIGGLVGYYDGDTIVTCYAAGAIHNGVDEVEEWDWGGLIGWSTVSDPIKDSFWDIEVSGVLESDGGVGKTTAEMQTQSTFVGVGWNFVTVWMICEGQDYPRLQWQNVQCQE